MGDLADTGNDADETVRAQAAQPLYDAGIGFFPMRGNHETYGTGNQFSIPVLKTLYPQTRGMQQHLRRHQLQQPDLGQHRAGWHELLIRLQQRPLRHRRSLGDSERGHSQAGYDFGYSITQQQPWISSRLDKSTRGTDHAFVMSHQPLIAENHQDTMFQGYTNANPDMQNAFYASLQNNNVKYFLAGHDHINQHSIIASPDGLSSVHEIIGASDSSKFYTPKSVTDGNWFGQKTRETSVAQELFTVGYYIFTVDGANVTVDFYSDNHGGWLSDANYPLGAGRPDTNITPLFSFVKKQSWGYSQNGTESLVAQGASYPTTPFTFASTTAQFLAGTNSSTAKDYTNRALPHAVDIGWDAATCETASAIMYLWGTADVAPPAATPSSSRCRSTPARSALPPWSAVASAWPRSRTSRATGPTPSRGTWAERPPSTPAPGTRALGMGSATMAWIPPPTPHGPWSTTPADSRSRASNAQQPTSLATQPRPWRLHRPQGRSSFGETTSRPVVHPFASRRIRPAGDRARRGWAPDPPQFRSARPSVVTRGQRKGHCRCPWR